MGYTSLQYFNAGCGGFGLYFFLYAICHHVAGASQTAVIRNSVAYLNGILKRTVEPFPAIAALLP